MRRRFRVSGILAAAVLAGACARRPTRELGQARAAIERAETAQAPIYAKGSYDEALRTLREAERLVRERKYDDARVVALESETHARSAVGMSAENKTKMLAALNLNLKTTEGEMADAEQEIGIAESRHVETAQIDLFRRDLVAARGKLGEARSRYAAGDLAGGRKWSDDARIAADMLLREIRFAVAERPITHPERKSRRRTPRAG